MHRPEQVPDGPTPEQRAARRKLATALIVVVMAVTGVAAAFLLLDAAERLGPTYQQRGLTGEYEGEYSGSYNRDGGSRDLILRQPVFVQGTGFVELTAGDQILLPRGNPVLLVRSAVDGEVVAVRTPISDTDLGLSPAEAAVSGGVVLAGLALLAGRRRIAPHVRWTVPTGIVLVSALVTVAVVTDGPETAEGRLAPAGSASLLDGHSRLPQRTAAVGAVTTLRDGAGGEPAAAVEVAVTGPPVAGPPAGADPRLREFDIVRIPVSTRLVRDDDDPHFARSLEFRATYPGGVPVALYGRPEPQLYGRPAPYAPTPPCGGAPGTQGLRPGPPGPAATPAELCVAVPWGGRADQLAIRFGTDEVLIDLPG